MVEPIALFPPHRVDPVEFAARQRRLFVYQNLRIGCSTTVHSVTWVDWINGLALPGPACRQGWSGLGAAGELLVTRSRVTCAKCQRLGGTPLDNSPIEDELSLFPLPRRDRGVRDGVCRLQKDAEAEEERRDAGAAHVMAEVMRDNQRPVTYLGRHALPVRAGIPGAKTETTGEDGMPQRGRRRPYKVEYRYLGQDRVSRVAESDEFEALTEARRIALSGAEVWVFHLNPHTHERTELAYHQAE